MIRHSVVFKLKFPAGSAQESKFLQAAAQLAGIPGVKNFKTLRQVSTRNPYDYCLMMDFGSAEAYDKYNNHPHHTAFIKQYWLIYVDQFMELDYQPLT